MTDTASTSTPPWGDDFDAEKAWTLVQNLRADKDKLQGEKESLTGELTTERQAREAAETKLTEADSEGKITAAEKRAKDAETSLWTERALRKHPELDEDLLDFLTGETEEEILGKAERLAKRGKPADKPDGDKPDGDNPDGTKPAGDQTSGDGSGLPGTPKPDLTPGHGGDQKPAFDPDAIVSAIRGNR
jgi:hypothetical protein